MRFPGARPRTHPDGNSHACPPPRPPTRRRRLLLLTTALVTLGTGGAIAAAPPGLPAPKEGLNLLVVGVDSRAGLTDDEKERYRLGHSECACTDVMMLMHVSTAGDRVSVVSLPRDSLARFPSGHTDRSTGETHAAHPAKINNAWKEGGPAFTIRTVEAMTDLPVHRYLEVDFRRFMDTVDAVDGGVPVCTPTRLKDPVTGLDLAPGTTALRGGEALQYVRSRRADGKMDFGRIQKQQKFLANLHHTLRGGPLNSPDALRALATTLRGTGRGERGVSVTELVELAGRLKDLPPSRTEFAVVPVRGFNPDIEGVGSTLAWDERQAGEVFAALRADRPLPRLAPAAPSDIPQGLGEYRPVEGGALLCA
ncbi:LCP family protein [Streptomyces laurentii]|uniref:LCP family protein n=1 Tax=Streptomyces laurentii TaxID=39478 RepID=UPI0036D16E5B